MVSIGLLGTLAVGVPITSTPAQAPVINEHAIALQPQKRTHPTVPPPMLYKPLQSRSGSAPTSVRYGNWMSFVATWYSGSGGSDGSTITKTGEHVLNGWTVAVDPSVIPLKSVIQVRFSDGTIRTYHAEDTGGAIIGNRIDIFDSNHWQSLVNGRQHVQVRIVKVFP